LESIQTFSRGGGSDEGSGIGGRLAWEDLSTEEFFTGERISMKGLLYFPALFKKQ
jgi:hypothetical protein